METMIDLDCSALRSGSAADLGPGSFVYTAPAAPGFVCADLQGSVHTFPLTGEDRFVLRLAGRTHFLAFATIWRGDKYAPRYGLRIVFANPTKDTPTRANFLGALCMTPSGCVLPVVDFHGHYHYVQLSSGKEIDFLDSAEWWFATEWSMSVVCYGVTEYEIAKRVPPGGG